MDFQKQCYELNFHCMDDANKFLLQLHNFCYGFKTKRIIITIDKLQEKYNWFNINNIAKPVLDYYIKYCITNRKINLGISPDLLYPAIFKDYKSKIIVQLVDNIPEVYIPKFIELAKFYFVNVNLPLEEYEMEKLWPFVNNKEYVISKVFSPNMIQQNQYSKIDFIVKKELAMCKKLIQPILDCAIINDNSINDYDFYLAKIGTVICKKNVLSTIRKIKNWEFVRFLNGVSKIKFLLQFFNENDPIQLRTHPDFLEEVTNHNLHYFYCEFIPELWNELNKEQFVKLVLQKNCKKWFIETGFEKFNCSDVFITDLKFRNCIMRLDCNIPFVQFLLHC